MSRSECTLHVSATLSFATLPHRQQTCILTCTRPCIQGKISRVSRGHTSNSASAVWHRRHQSMSAEQSKSPAEQPAQPAPPVPGYPPLYNGAHFPHLPPNGYPPPYYAYAPVPDPNHDPNAPGGPPPVPYVMFAPPPPGMVYAYAPPPPGQSTHPYLLDVKSVCSPVHVVPYSYPPPAPAPAPPAGPPAPRPKRKQVKMAVSALHAQSISLLSMA